MKKSEYENFIKNKGFIQTNAGRLDSDKYIILITGNVLQIFNKVDPIVEDFIIRRYPPSLIDIYNLDDVEITGDRIKLKKKIVSNKKE